MRLSTLSVKMNESTRAYIENLLSQPDNLLRKKPFYRAIKGKATSSSRATGSTVDLTGTVPVSLPNIRMVTVTQDQFMQELDVYSHKVLFDENVPAITVKTKKKRVP